MQFTIEDWTPAVTETEPPQYDPDCYRLKLLRNQMHGTGKYHAEICDHCKEYCNAT